MELLNEQGRVVASELLTLLGVSADTIRRDLDELAQERRLHRIHGGALPRATTADTYEGRQKQSMSGKEKVARAAVTLLQPGQVAILDGGTTALLVAQMIPPTHRGTIVTHSPVVASALGSHPSVEVILIGGTLEKRAMVTIGADVIKAYRGILADICFLGVWSVHAEAGLSCGYYEEARVREAMVARADTVVGLTSSDKLGTVAPYWFAPATALTHLATEPDAPPELLRPFRELNIKIV